MKLRASASVSTRVTAPGGSWPMVPITSGWPAWPISMISRPSRKWMLGLAVDLGHQRAGGVELEEVARLRRRRHRFGDAVGGEDHRLVGRGNLVELLDEDRALGLEALDDIAVVHDLVADIDRRAVLSQRQLDDLDGAVDAGAEAARAAEEDVEGGLVASWRA